MELSDFSTIEVSPRCIATEAFDFYDQRISPCADYAPEMVSIARVDQRERIENGLGLTAAGFTDGSQFFPGRYNDDALNLFRVHLRSIHPQRTVGHPSWQFLSFMDGSDFSGGYIPYIVKGHPGEDDPVVVVAEVNRTRLGMDTAGEVVVQGGLIQDDIVGVYDIHDVNEIQECMTDLTKARSKIYSTLRELRIHIPIDYDRTSELEPLRLPNE